jgi:hypothetical protein
LVGASLLWDIPTVIVTLDSKRRLTVPTALAPPSPGEHFEARFDAEEDAIVFRRLPAKENWLEVLKACPVSPDDVPPRRRSPARRHGLVIATGNDRHFRRPGLKVFNPFKELS